MTEQAANPSNLQWNWAIFNGKLEFAIGDLDNPILEFELKPDAILEDLEDDVREADILNTDWQLDDWKDFLEVLKNLVERMENALP